MINRFKITSRALLALLWIYQAHAPLHAEVILRGWVVAVHDGDTLSLLMSGNRQVRIRLAQIDAPELDQPFGYQSKQSLADMVFDRNVAVSAETVDRDGRTVGTVYANGLDVNREQIRRGMAWAYRQYLHDDSLLEIERLARRSKTGLWSDSRPMSPWRYRHGAQNGSRTDSGHAKDGLARRHSDGSCGEKRSCREMTSCEEAKFYLNRCGLARLDGDHDGVPCETLCNGGRTFSPD